MQRFPLFPEHSVEFWSPGASQFLGLQNCKPWQPCPREQCTLMRLMAVTKPTVFKALPSCHKHCSDGWESRIPEFSPLLIRSPALQFCLFLQEGTGNSEILPSTSLLNTLKQQWHKCTQSNTQDESAPALLQDTCESLLILPQLKGRACSALGYSPPWRKPWPCPPTVVEDKESSGIWWNPHYLELEWGHMQIQVDTPPPMSRRPLQIFLHHWV